ncbi:hypothetical protein U9M48_014489 [Paspalum notatum var. saurae]|uniref:Uncharacterized protein n=1 Tax=Paspalum notatum var. saurae TaxID=547442 RepID=A0AAQ3WKK6_PASNO
MCTSSDYTCKATAYKLRKDYEATFYDGESVVDFTMRLTRTVHQLEALVIQFAQIVLSISMLLDILTMSIEVVMRRLKGVDDHLDPDHTLPLTADGKLPLMNEQWLTCQVRHAGEGGSQSATSSDGTAAPCNCDLGSWLHPIS